MWLNRPSARLHCASARRRPHCLGLLSIGRHLDARLDPLLARLLSSAPHECPSPRLPPSSHADSTFMPLLRGHCSRAHACPVHTRSSSTRRHPRGVLCGNPRWNCRRVTFRAPRPSNGSEVSCPCPYDASPLTFPAVMPLLCACIRVTVEEISCDSRRRHQDTVHTLSFLIREFRGLYHDSEKRREETDRENQSWRRNSICGTLHCTRCWVHHLSH